MSISINEVSVDFVGFSPINVDQNRIFWVRNNINNPEGNFSLMTKVGREEVVVGSGYQDYPSSKWRCTITSYYNEENDTDVKLVGVFENRTLCRMALWNARHWSILEE